MLFKHLSFVLIFISCNYNSFAQKPISFVNTYTELIESYLKMSAPEEEVILWGKYIGFSNSDKAYTAVCLEANLNNSDFKNITTFLEFKLFNAFNIIKQPIKEPKVVLSQLKEGDLIKCKVRLFKYCKFPKDDMLFLIEEIY